MTWSDLKQLIKALYDPYISAGFIESESGSPTDLALLVQMVNRKIVSSAPDLSFTKVKGTFTASGSAEVNLATEFPDLYKVYQIWGVNDNQEHPYQPNYDANIITVDGYTLRNKILSYTGNEPASGITMNIQYGSKYLVEDASGNRKLNFTDDTDVTVLDGASLDYLTFELGRFINWKTDEQSQSRREEIINWAKEAKENMILGDNEATRQLDSFM